MANSHLSRLFTFIVIRFNVDADDGNVHGSLVETVYIVCSDTAYTLCVHAALCVHST